MAAGRERSTCDSGLKEPAFAVRVVQDDTVVLMPDVFLLGAGFSKAVSNHMPDLREMSEILRGRIDYPPRVESLTSNVEHVMTYLSQSQPWLAEPDNLENRATFLRVTREIGSLLEERTRKAVKQSCPEFLKALVNYWHRTHAA